MNDPVERMETVRGMRGRVAAVMAMASLGWVACGPPGGAAGPTGPQPAPGNADAATSPAPATRSGPRVLVISVDGLMPDAYMNPDVHGLKVPTLRMLVARGAHSPGVLSVFPTETYPAHTAMVTGVSPGAHGIVTNLSLDPLNKNKGGWRWYTSDIRVPTIWQLAKRAGLRTALITWPVTVGAEADALVPEYWRAGTADDVKLVTAMSTRGLIDRVAARFPDFRKNFVPPDTIDAAQFDIAEYLLETEPPDLMLLHCWMVDEYQHRDGPWSPAAIAQIEEADRQIGRLITAVERTVGWEDTILVVVSDHGFLSVKQWFRPGAVLADLGLVKPGEGDALLEAKAWVRSSTGAVFVYVADESDEATKRAVADAFGKLAGKPDSALARVLTNDEIRARGGDPAAFLALLPADGFALIDGYKEPRLKPAGSKGSHGFDPALPAMKASLLVYGAGIAPGEIPGARLIDVGPTIASWLGLTMPDVEGVPLTVPRADAAGR